MEKVRQAILEIADVYEEITRLLAAHNPQMGTATYSMLRDSKSVVSYTEQIGSKSDFSADELSLIMGITTGFSRHLAEVEQTVYEYIGSEDYDKLTAFIDKALIPYNYIWHYRKGI